jgi:hypothetical protein
MGGNKQHKAAIGERNVKSEFKMHREECKIYDMGSEGG